MKITSTRLLSPNVPPATLAAALVQVPEAVRSQEVVQRWANNIACLELAGLLLHRAHISVNAITILPAGESIMKMNIIALACLLAASQCRPIRLYFQRFTSQSLNFRGDEHNVSISNRQATVPRR